MSTTRKYLDPLLLNSLGNLELVAKCAVEGFYAGLHPSPFHGFSVEYSDHRPYERGDELRFLDWKMFGRSDKLYVKQFLQETNVPVHILLDSSNSMAFRGEGAVSKLDYGSFLAAALAYLMLGQADSVGLILFGERVRVHVPGRSRRSHLNTLLTALEKNRPEGKTNLASVLHTVAEMVRRQGIIILISDLLEDEEGVHGGLAHLKYLRHDVIVFHTLDHQEITLDYDGLIEFQDMESSERIRAFPRSLRESYQQRVSDFITGIERTAGERGIDYCLLDTSKPLDRALSAYLAKRKRSM